jgi:hypothetical protein
METLAMDMTTSCHGEVASRTGQGRACHTAERERQTANGKQNGNGSTRGWPDDAYFWLCIVGLEATTRDDNSTRRERKRNEHTDRQTDRQTGRQTDRQTHGNIDGRQIERLVLLAVCWWEKQDCLAAKACNAARHAAACGVTCGMIIAWRVASSTRTSWRWRVRHCAECFLVLPEAAHLSSR